TRLLPGGDVLVTAQDLTAMRRLETVRSDFVANVSHELRTPIASIKAMVETLESGGLRDATAAPDFLARIHREVDDLAQIVTELLSLARIESGAEPLDLAPTDAAELVRSAADRMRALAERGGIALSVAPLPALPRVSVDRDKIATVFANLIHNAVTFTAAGGSVVLAASRDDGHVAFTVRDTGSGIARSDLERIFERFYKADPSRSREGTGLGLAIAKHIVLAHGGQIRAESEGPGRGSTFRFTMPIAPAP
ncbi:MAG: PAS domain-containing sensor histidine kinase, partial [Chloroflexota bacterium]|nr:PAS domain-containing sensor histidine kinase [Chloroflexota bacterium]